MIQQSWLFSAEVKLLWSATASGVVTGGLTGWSPRAALVKGAAH